jgi:Domain of unknown function (DUF2017)
MATAFRRKGSRVIGRLDGQERAIVTGLMASTRDLLDADERPSSGDVFTDLMRQLEKPTATEAEVAGRDPALQRLLPPASREDEQLASDFRAMTEESLRQRKTANLTTAIEALRDSSSGRIELDLGQAQAVMIALTDVRLVLGERLGIRTDEDSERLHALVEAGLDDDDPQVTAAIIYDLLTWLQETIAQALLD